LCFEEYVTKYFGFDKVLPMNTGAEAVETAIKLKKMGMKQRYPENQGQIIVCENNFMVEQLPLYLSQMMKMHVKNFGPLQRIYKDSL
jgi:ornithine--oxo-acid transaminase